MTAYSYDAVGKVQKDVIDNAITRFMFEIGWFGSPEEGYRGSSWVGTIPPATGLTGTVRLQLNTASTSSLPGDIPPGATYVGDKQEGYVLMQLFDLDPWVAIYEPIIDRINTAFEGWRFLPDHRDFDAPIQALEDACDAITPAKQGEGDWTFADVEVTKAMALLSKWTGNDPDRPSSALLFAFDSVYGIPGLTPVMSNQAQVLAALGFAVAGEKQIWLKGGEDLMRVIEDGASAMDPRNDGGGTIDLNVVKAFVDLASIFVPKQIGSILDGVSGVLGFLDEVVPQQQVTEKETTVKGSTYEEIMTSLEDALRSLEWAINNEEVEICNKLDKLAGVIEGRPATDFHIHPGAGMDHELTEAAETTINVPVVQTIGTREVPVIAGAFLDAAELAAGHTGEGIWTRENGIGWGTSGPWSRWSHLLSVFDAMSTGTARELVDAGKLLAVGAGWIEDADFDAYQALKGHSDELARGRTDWSYQ